MITSTNEVIEQIKTDIKNFTDAAIIGLSGGADSTLVACLCVEALGKENVYGVHMPYDRDDMNTFNDRSTKLAKRLGIQSLYAPIKEIADSIINTTKGAYEGTDLPNGDFLATPMFGDDKFSLINKGNARARARMCVLYSISAHLGEKLGTRVRVMNTCNHSETLANYETKYGDGAGDLCVIGEFFKSEVYQLLDYFRVSHIITEEFIDRIPSAGLWKNQSDQEEIGASYNEMEPYQREILGYNFLTFKKWKGLMEAFLTAKHNYTYQPPKEATGQGDEMNFGKNRLGGNRYTEINGEIVSIEESSGKPMFGQEIGGGIHDCLRIMYKIAPKGRHAIISQRDIGTFSHLPCFDSYYIFTGTGADELEALYGDEMDVERIPSDFKNTRTFAAAKSFLL